MFRPELPIPQVPQEDIPQPITETEAESPMFEPLPFNIDMTFDILKIIITQFNEWAEEHGERISEEMRENQRKAVITMHDITTKMAKEDRPKSKEELISELNKREKAGLINTAVNELITGIL